MEMLSISMFVKIKAFCVGCTYAEHNIYKPFDHYKLKKPYNPYKLHKPYKPYKLHKPFL